MRLFILATAISFTAISAQAFQNMYSFDRTTYPYRYSFTGQGQVSNRGLVIVIPPARRITIAIDRSDASQVAMSERAFNGTVSLQCSGRHTRLVGSIQAEVIGGCRLLGIYAAPPPKLPAPIVVKVSEPLPPAPVYEGPPAGYVNPFMMRGIASEPQAPAPVAYQAPRNERYRPFRTSRGGAVP